MKGMLLPVTCALALAAATPAALAKGGDDGHRDQGHDAPAQVQGSDDPANHDAQDDRGQNAGADDLGARENGRQAQAHKARKAGLAGKCSGRSTSKLKANPPRNGRIQVEFEVESHISGQVWTVQMDDNGATFFKGKKTTQAPGGSFDARASAKDQAGTDTVTASATNSATGETCSASMSV